MNNEMIALMFSMLFISKELDHDVFSADKLDKEPIEWIMLRQWEHYHHVLESLERNPF